MPLSLLFVSGFMCVFSIVIAFFKDIPDVKGDRQSSIPTLSVRLGVCCALPRVLALRFSDARAVTGAYHAERVRDDAARRICRVCAGLPRPCTRALTPARARSAIAFGALSASMWCRVVLVGTHTLLASRLLHTARTCDPGDAKSTYAAYMQLWQLFYAEYALIPLFGR